MKDFQHRIAYSRDILRAIGVNLKEAEKMSQEDRVLFYKRRCENMIVSLKNEIGMLESAMYLDHKMDTLMREKHGSVYETGE